jgi:hypothetical protein
MLIPIDSKLSLGCAIVNSGVSVSVRNGKRKIREGKLRYRSFIVLVQTLLLSLEYSQGYRCECKSCRCIHVLGIYKPLPASPSSSYNSTLLLQQSTTLRTILYTDTPILHIH